MKKPRRAALKKWYDLYLLWKKSGLSQLQWCRLNNICYKSFHPAITRYQFVKRKSTKELIISSLPETKCFFMYSKLINIHWSFDKFLCTVNKSIPDDFIESSHFIFLSSYCRYMKVFFLDEHGPNILFRRSEKGVYKIETSEIMFGDFYQL